MGYNEYGVCKVTTTKTIIMFTTLVKKAGSNDDVALTMLGY